MTREDITRMAREAGFLVDEADFITTLKNGRIGFQIELERFAALVAEAEREACAKVCDYAATECSYGSDGWYTAKTLAAAIRARGSK
jgi:hypothetical protein